MAYQDAYAALGVLVFSALALLHGLVWRARREYWSLHFAVAYALLLLIYAFDAQLQPVGGRPHPLSAAAAAAAATLLLLGMVDYVGLPRPWRRRWEVGAGALGVIAGVLVVGGFLPRLPSMLLLAMFLAAQAVLAVWAMRHEPRSGHGFVVIALALFPVLVLAAVFGEVPVPLLRYAVILPLAVSGMTMLTTGLLRAHRRADLELARRVEAEEGLRALNASLEQRVAQRTAELTEMVDSLESFNRSVSHDLRGPLGGIAGVADLAREALARGDAARAAQLLEAIGAQAGASMALVNDLLSLARLGRATLQPRPVALAPLVHEAVAALQQHDGTTRRAEVVVHALPEVVADPGLLRQVVLNLVGNALKFTEGRPQPRVEVGAQPGDAGPVIFVRDNGVGFDAAQAQALFEPFRRLHGERFPGHGVGLSIVKRIVERHGGRVWADGAPGAGATFLFTLGGERVRSPP